MTRKKMKEETLDHSARNNQSQKPSSTTLSVTIISFGLPSAYGKRMVKCNKLLCARRSQLVG